MQRIPLVAESWRLWSVLVCALVLSPTGFAQDAGPELEPTRIRLAILQSCLGQGNVALLDLSHGLLVGWWVKGSSGGRVSGKPASPPPVEYLKSLDLDAKACMFAGKIKDKARKQMILDAVAEDIAIKAADCHHFGMGRTISVHVSTLRGTNAEHGWEVYYKWNCASDFQPAEMRAPQLTSPATVQLPPGNYLIRAQKKISDTQILNSGPAKTVIGMQASIDIQLPIQ